MVMFITAFGGVPTGSTDIGIAFDIHTTANTLLRWKLGIQSIHGIKAPLPFVNSIEVTFPERPDMKSAFLQKQPFCLVRVTARKRSFKIVLKFNLSDGCGCSDVTSEWLVNFQVKKNSFFRDENEVIRNLRDEADQASSCGQHAIVERNVLPRSEATIDAFVTNIVRYDHTPEAYTAPLEITTDSNGIVIRRCNEGENANEMQSKRSKWS